MTIQQAYNIDKKTDDGFPTTGNVLAEYISGTTITNAPNGGSSGSDCYDGGTYDVGVNSGLGANCALIFKFQN
jgi:hypothetical protein